MNAIKPTKGRPKGSNSFVKVKLSDLVTLLGAGVNIPVSRIWLREMGINIDDSAAAAVTLPHATPQEIAAVVPVAPIEERVQFTLTTFDEE